jgi:hypothetical protein
VTYKVQNERGKKLNLRGRIMMMMMMMMIQISKLLYLIVNVKFATDFSLQFVISWADLREKTEIMASIAYARELSSTV